MHHDFVVLGPCADGIDRRLGAHFGFLASAGGLAVLVGGTGVGALLDRAAPRRAAQPGPGAALPWPVLAVLPALSAVGLWLPARRIDHAPAPSPAAPAVPAGHPGDRQPGMS
ncbi:hypothetical protein [Modestobacter sp. URMC 112]